MAGKEARQIEAERLGGEALLEKLTELVNGQKSMLDAVDKLDDRCRDAEIAIQGLYKGFPGGDAEGHRRAHEMMMADVESRKRLTEAIREKTLSGLVWACIVGIGAAVWHELITMISQSMGKGG